MHSTLRTLLPPAGADATTTSAGTPPGLVTQLQAEHDEIRQLFDTYEGLQAEGAAPPLRQALAARICLALALHALVEEELVYPAARRLPACRRATAEAEVEHAAARLLIDELALMAPDDALFDAHVSVLGAHVRHHLAEEEELLLPDLVHSGMDLQALGAQARARRLALQQELDALDDED